MATPHLGLPNDYVDGVTPGSASVFNFLDGVIDSQVIGSLQAQGAGIYAIPDETSLTASVSSGLIAAIAAGAAIITQSTYGNIFACQQSPTTFTLPASVTNHYLFVIIEVVVNGNDTRATGVPNYTTGSSPTLDGGQLIAKFTTSGSAITSITPMRALKVPLSWRGAWDSAAYYTLGDAVSSGGSAWISLTSNHNVTPVEGSDWTALPNAADGSGDAQVTCTAGGTIVGTAADSKCGNISLNGTPSADFVYQVFDLTQRAWLFSNNTAHTVTVQPPTGTGQMIAAGAQAALQCDGVNIIPAVASGGTVTEVGLVLPSNTFQMPVTPVTSSGNLDAPFINQTPGSYLRTPGTAGGAQTPDWGGIPSVDLPNSGITPATVGGASYTPTATFDVKGRLTAWVNNAIAIAGSAITSGLVALARGGTNADLSATGGTGKFLKQLTSGAAVSVDVILASEIPTGVDAAKLADGSVSNAELERINSVTSNVQDQLDAKAPLASPALTGTPTAPTAAADTNTTQIADTAFVVGQKGTATPIVDGSATAGTSLRYSSQDHVHPTDTSRAPLASPTFTGTPAAPTAAPGTNTTQLATTEFVLANSGGGDDGIGYVEVDVSAGSLTLTLAQTQCGNIILIGSPGGNLTVTMFDNDYRMWPEIFNTTTVDITISNGDANTFVITSSAGSYSLASVPGFGIYNFLVFDKIAGTLLASQVSGTQTDGYGIILASGTPGWFPIGNYVAVDVTGSSSVTLTQAQANASSILLYGAITADIIVGWDNASQTHLVNIYSEVTGAHVLSAGSVSAPLAVINITPGFPVVAQVFGETQILLVPDDLFYQSNSTVLFGTGSKTFNFQAGIPWRVGDTVRAIQIPTEWAVGSGPTDYMEGIITSVGSPPACVVNVTTASVMSGTGSNWRIILVQSANAKAFTGDSGSGGVKGLVPAPAAGDAAALKVLGASGAWVTQDASASAELYYANTSIPGGNTVANTTTPTAFTSTFTIPANSLSAPCIFDILAGGLYGNIATLPGTLTIEIDFNGSAVLTTGAIALAASLLTNQGWRIQANVIVQSTGGSGQFEIQGYEMFDQGVTTLVDSLTNTSAFTINTTANIVVTVKATFSAANSGNTVTLRQLIAFLAEEAGASDAVGGDLSGFLPNPTVSGLQNRALASTAPSDGQAIVWDAGGSTWKPGTVSGGGVIPTDQLLAWWKADAQQGYSDGDTMDFIADSAGLNHLYSGSGFTYKTGIQNSLPACLCAHGQSYVIPVPLSLNACTVFIVAKNTDTSNGSFYLVSSGGASVYMGVTHGTPVVVRFAHEDPQYAVSGTIVETDWHYITSYQNRNSATTRVDGVAGSANTSMSIGDNLKFDKVSGYVTSGYQVAGYIGEIILYSRVLSGGEISAVESYLSTKWGL